MQVPTGPPAMAHLAALRGCFELYAFSTYFSFRWTIPATPRAATPKDLAAFLLEGWARHVASYTADTSQQHVAALRWLGAGAGEPQEGVGKGNHTGEGRARDADTAETRALFRPFAGPLLLLAAPYGHETGLQGEWIEYDNKAPVGVWKELAELRAHGLPLRPSPLHYIDNKLGTFNAELQNRAAEMLASLPPADAFTGDESNAPLTSKAAMIVENVMALSARLPDHRDPLEQSVAPDMAVGSPVTAPTGIIPAWRQWPQAALLESHFAGRDTTPPHVCAMAACLLPSPAHFVLTQAVYNALKAAPAASYEDGQRGSVIRLTPTPASRQVRSEDMSTVDVTSSTQGSTELHSLSRVSECVPKSHRSGCVTCDLIHQTNAEVLHATQVYKKAVQRWQSAKSAVHAVLSPMDAVLCSSLGFAAPARSISFKVCNPCLCVSGHGCCVPSCHALKVICACGRARQLCLKALSMPCQCMKHECHGVSSNHGRDSITRACDAANTIRFAGFASGV
jgi:hypothetical protein